MSYFLNYAEINLGYLHDNLAFLKSKTACDDIAVVAMVKANAYGHGAVEIAQALSATVEYFGVATVEEGLQLRNAGINNEIIVFSGFCHALQLMQIKQAKLIPLIHSDYHYALVKEDILKHHFPAWIQLNTGMNQLGLSASQFDDIYADLVSHDQTIAVNVMTHFADADNANPSFTYQQIEAFRRMIGVKQVEKVSATNSAGIIRFFDSRLFNTIRPGIALYGVNPIAPCSDLQPIMSFKARIISIRKLERGEPLGYGCTYIAEKLTLVVTIAAGYGDGYPRHISAGAPVLVHGKRCPLIGRVSMDVLTVDISDLDVAVNIGDVVTLWGDGLAVSEIATYANTIPYTLTTGLTARVKRIYINRKI